MNTLRLFIDGNWPHEHSDCDWVLLGPGGQMLQRGRSEPRHWPGVDAQEPKAAEANRCEVVLSADQAVCLPIQLPKGAAGRRPDVVAYAVEERLLDEPEYTHFTIDAVIGDGKASVIAVAKHRLRTLLGTLTEIGLAPLRVMVEPQLAPEATRERWTLLRRGERGCLVARDTWLALDRVDASTPPPPLAWAVDEAAQRPAELRVQGDAVDDEAWSTALGLTVVSGGSVPGLLPTSAPNLLHGEFTPAREHRLFWRSYRPALVIAAVIAVGYTLASLGEWAWLAYQARHLQEQRLSLFRRTFPQVGTIVDPVLQLQRSLDAERLRHGQLGEADFLSLMNALAAASGPVEQISFVGGRMQVTLSTRDVEALHGQLAARGVTSSLRPGPAGKIVLELSKGELP